MKTILRTITAATMILALSLSANAQKMAHINLDSLLSMMPESKTAKQSGQDYYKQLEATVATMQTELQTKYQEYTQNQGTYTDLIKQTKEKELNELNQRIQDFQVSAQQDLQKKNEALSKPIYEKAKKAIDQVAKENGYKYVFDTSSGIVLYSEPSDDVLGLVKKKLDLTAPASAPAAAPGKETKKESK